MMHSSLLGYFKRLYFLTQEKDRQCMLQHVGCVIFPFLTYHSCLCMDLYKCSLEYSLHYRDPNLAASVPGISLLALECN